MKLSEQINAQYLDPNRDEFAFWSSIRDYVGKVCNRWVSQDFIDEVTQDTTHQVWSSLGKFKPVDTSSFTRWNSLAFAGAVLTNYLVITMISKEIAISQLGAEGSDGEFIELDFEQLTAPLSEDHYKDLLDRELRDIGLLLQLRHIRGLLQRQDLPLFDLLRAGKNQAQAARALYISSGTVMNRIKAWRKIAAAHTTKGQQ